MLDTLLERRALDEKRKRPVTNGCLNIRRLNGKCFFKLIGDFDSNNIVGISEAIVVSTSFQKKYLELDMSGVERINMRAMARLSISLKTLKDNGIYTKITGIDGGIRKIAHELGMHYITQIV